MATIKQLTEIISGRLTPSSKKLDSTLVDIKAGSKLTATPDGLDVDLTGLAASDDLNSKVDKVAGKGLSDANFTQLEKDKLAGLEGSKYLGTYASLSALNSAHATATAGNYADVDAGAGIDVQRYIWDVSDSKWVVMQGGGGTLTAAQVKTLYESNSDTNAFTDDYKDALDTLDDSYQPKAVNTNKNQFNTNKVNSLPLYTLDNNGEYVLCEPDIWIKVNNYYVPAYSAVTLGE